MAVHAKTNTHKSVVIPILWLMDDMSSDLLFLKGRSHCIGIGCVYQGGAAVLRCVIMSAVRLFGSYGGSMMLLAQHH